MMSFYALQVSSEQIFLSADPGYKISKEWIRCFDKNVIDHLFVATSQPINDRREQMLRPDTSQLSLIRVPFVH